MLELPKKFDDFSSTMTVNINLQIEMLEKQISLLLTKVDDPTPAQTDGFKLDDSHMDYESLATETEDNLSDKKEDEVNSSKNSSPTNNEHQNGTVS